MFYEIIKKKNNKNVINIMLYKKKLNLKFKPCLNLFEIIEPD